MPVAHRRAGNPVAGVLRVAGFQPVGPFDPRRSLKKGIVRPHFERSRGGPEHAVFSAGVFENVRVPAQFARKDGHVARSRDVIVLSFRGRQPVDRRKARVLHSEFGGALVHAAHHLLARSGHVFGDGHRRVVRALDHESVEHVFQRKALLRIEINLGASHLFGPDGNADHFGGAVFAALNGLLDQQQVHHLNHAGGQAWHVRVVREEDPPGGVVYRDRAAIRRLGNRRSVFGGARRKGGDRRVSGRNTALPDRRQRDGARCLRRRPGASGRGGGGGARRRRARGGGRFCGARAAGGGRPRGRGLGAAGLARTYAKRREGVFQPRRLRARLLQFGFQTPRLRARLFGLRRERGGWIGRRSGLLRAAVPPAA